MDSLQSVSDDFDLDNAFAGWADGLAVTLPSLQSVGFLKLGGNLTRHACSIP